MRHVLVYRWDMLLSDSLAGLQPARFRICAHQAILFGVRATAYQTEDPGS